MQLESKIVSCNTKTLNTYIQPKDNIYKWRVCLVLLKRCSFEVFPQWQHRQLPLNTVVSVDTGSASTSSRCHDPSWSWLRTPAMSYPRFTSRLCKQEQDAYETKVAAAEFYRLNRVPEQIERALNELFLHKPEDLHGYLVRASNANANHTANLTPAVKTLRVCV